MFASSRWFRTLALLLVLALAAPAAQALPVRGDANPDAVLNPGSLSGLWYDPDQSGQGFSFSFNSSGTLAVTWYVYSQTQQIWLVGSASLVGNVATVPVFISSGASFPPDFQPGQVTLTPWGTLTVTVRNCALVNVAWTSTQPGFGSGNVDVVPLIVAGGLQCQVTNADDHGGSCSEATAAPANGSLNGRIEPQDDSDFFRIDVASIGVVEVRSRAGAGLDPFGTLYDAQCNELSDDDDTDGSNFLLSRGVVPGTYYARIKSFNSESTGDYALDFVFEASAPGGDDHPDDCANATPAPLNGTATGVIDPSNDRDYFRYTLTQPGTLEIASQRQGDLDPVGALVDADCEILTENDDNGDVRDFLVGALLPPGTYYLKVRSYEDGSTGAYAVNATFTQNATDDHGNDCANATAVAPTSTTQGTIAPRFDLDVFRFELPVRGMLVGEATRLGDVAPVDPLIQLLDASCEQVFEDDDGGPGQNPRMSLALEAGTYYMRMRSYNDDTNGPYTLGLRYFAQQPGPDEHGDSCASATPLGQYGSGMGRIDPTNDTDYFRIDAEFDAELTVYSFETKDGGLDPFGELLDASCNVIVENDDSDGFDFSVAAPATPGTYYVRISSAGAATRGDYTFGFYYVSSNGKAASATPRARPPTKRVASKGSGDPPRIALDSARHARALDTPAPAANLDTKALKAVTNPASLSGLWYDPSRAGQGFSFSFNQAGVVAATWYVYNGGRQIWLIGSGPLQGNRAELPTVITNGALFPPGFSTGSVVQSNWGTLTLDVRSCTRIDVTWTSMLAGYPSGTMTLEPLIVAGGLPCGVSSEADDHGNSCNAATAATTNGTSVGRIDPTSDLDYFRLNVASAGTLTVQSSRTTTLNATGALLDNNCGVLAESDNAAGREFAITRTVTPGTYHVRVASSSAATVGDYAVSNAFSAATGSTGVTLSLRNELLYDVDFRANGGAPIRVPSGGLAQRTVTVSGPLSVSFALVDAVNQDFASVGDLQGGVFEPVSSPSGTIEYTVRNQIGDQIYFAPSISNSTSGALLVGVNMGTPDENRCNCVLPAQAKDVLVGYYRLNATSNVRGYNAGSSYSGNFTALPAPGIPVPLSGFVETPSGRIVVNFKRPP